VDLGLLGLGLVAVWGLGLGCCLGFGLLFEVWTWLLFGLAGLGLAVQQDLVGLLLLIRFYNF
jgi:hypothetical protein